MDVALDMVIRTPLVVKLKKLRPEEEWRCEISYLDKEKNIQDASRVEQAVIEGQCPCVPSLRRMSGPALQWGL